MLKFLKDLFSNPDGTGSTKRTAGWLLLICAVIVGFSGLFFSPNALFFDVVFFGFLTTATSLFGLSSYDYLSFIKNPNSKQNETIIPGPN